MANLLYSNARYLRKEFSKCSMSLLMNAIKKSIVSFIRIEFFLFICSSYCMAEEPCIQEFGSAGANSFKMNARELLVALQNKPETIYPSIQDGIKAKVVIREPKKYINTDDNGVQEFPSYSNCKKSFFRVATIDGKTDQLISNEGWKSGWVRRQDELKKADKIPSNIMFDAISPAEPIEDRIIQYVRVKNKPSKFPKHSSIVGLLENPIRALSVGYHTGYNNGIAGGHMRLDEIELGPCAKAPECQAIIPTNTTEVFQKKKLEPRYSTAGEWAVSLHIPPNCSVAVYRIKFGKVNDTCYSDSNDNCSFRK